MTNHDEFKLAFAHVEKLLDRRQLTTSFYLSVNTGIFATIGLLVKDARLAEAWLTVAILLLLFAGFIACWIWRGLLRQYFVLLDWWYARVRELEDRIPGSAQLITREYQDLYVAVEKGKSTKRIGMTRLELALNWIFTGLYVAFAIGLALNWLV